MTATAHEAPRGRTTRRRKIKTAAKDIAKSDVVADVAFTVITRWVRGKA